MYTWTYDKSFEGFLTLVFDSFDMKTTPGSVVTDAREQHSLFAPDYTVITDDRKAERVWTGLLKKISTQSCRMIYRVFLSELENIELLLLAYIQEVFSSKINIETNFGNVSVMEMTKVHKSVCREAERVRMFVRFQKTADNIYYASFDPKYNVLPITMEHFEKRFADQQWLIYDTRRQYGFYYNMKETAEVRFTESNIDARTGEIDESIKAPDERKFQELWKTYFQSACIKERVNPRLHMQLMPKRFWKYLPEKQ